jgi:hypothetical protein
MRFVGTSQAPTEPMFILEDVRSTANLDGYPGKLVCGTRGLGQFWPIAGP